MPGGFKFLIWLQLKVGNQGWPLRRGTYMSVTALGVNSHFVLCCQSLQTASTNIHDANNTLQQAKAMALRNNVDAAQVSVRAGG